jgi:flavin-dependent dehydrogenase
VYDVVIVGASFAGLAVAHCLRGRKVLLVDRKPVGEEQTSACATVLSAMARWDLEEAVLQRHNQVVLHTRRRTISFASPYSWCTFDYRGLCEILFQRSGAAFLQARAQRVDGERVITDRGDVAGRCIVDASGWRAVLSSTERLRRGVMNFGVNMVAPMPTAAGLDASALHFWYPSDIMAHAMAWVFPRGANATIGMGSYRGARAMRAPLERFTRLLGTEMTTLHGAYIPHALCRPTVGRIFVVGDAAGQCIALTGEGVRPALFFGEACGRAIERVLSGELSLAQGQAEYAAVVARKAGFYRFFTGAQAILTRVPMLSVEWLSRLVASEPMRTRVLGHYWSLTSEWGPPV